MTEVVENFVSANGLTSCVLTAGNPKNPAVFLLHGAGPGANAAANWYHLMPDLAKHFFVIAPDLIGFGKSTIPSPAPDNIMRWIGIRVEQCLGLMDYYQIKIAHVVGNSMGGALTLQMISEQPDRFDKVVLMGSIGAPAPRTPELVRLLSFYSDPRFARYKQLMHSFAYDPDSFEGMDEIINNRYKIATDPETMEVAAKMIDSMKVGIEALAMPPSILNKLPHQVLIFHGRQDRIVPLDTSLYLLQHLKNAELYVLDRSGHWAQLQRWDAMGPMIKKHFGVVNNS
ncbi:alpha/beta fold hydrolase [Extensimonas vulgaris]|uniref:Pimeloyl-ACP methyl ester carboxylesterase n=1 Tax=Extensimonas vulgaris TaxID=1031594 RepID=A0A369ALV5_9BURK|nr:alpha/beta hydrolase [Extensimonas vulgaris]RCX10083.1 pimeloyl-ACP methyl ester carboxylesterase [Extensimonas vulgaris]TWI36520.1 pimeloyl-ACP methyl ester carboxylesterase [Extensimonas vulgaris]TXD17236.1 alpha/beta fold hydrolase [Extensimonas vulgaris]